MFKITLPLLVIALLIVSCAVPPFAPPTPTATATAIPSSTATLTPVPTSTATPTATVTETPVPAPTSTLSPGAPHSRDEFVIMVNAGLIHCQGYDTNGVSQRDSFLSQATFAGFVPKGTLVIGSGIPSVEDPSACYYLITIYNAKHYIIYKDSVKNRFVKIALKN